MSLLSRLGKRIQQLGLFHQESIFLGCSYTLVLKASKLLSVIRKLRSDGALVGVSKSSHKDYKDCQDILQALKFKYICLYPSILISDDKFGFNYKMCKDKNTLWLVSTSKKRLQDLPIFMHCRHCSPFKQILKKGHLLSTMHGTQLTAQ